MIILAETCLLVVVVVVVQSVGMTASEWAMSYCPGSA